MSHANIHFIFFPFELESWGSVNGGKLDFFPQFIDWPNGSIEFWKRIDRVLEINLKIKSSFFCIDLTHTFGFTLQFNKTISRRQTLSYKPGTPQRSKKKRTTLI